MLAAGLLALAFAPLTSLAAAPAAGPTYVYWDENERVLFWVDPSTGPVSTMVPYYDTNGQLCVFPDGSGRFTTAYNPTGKGQATNPGYAKPKMEPPVGEAVWNRNGDFSGKTLYVPGPYHLPGQTVGGDIPPDPDGTFNSNGTFTGCVFDNRGDFFAVDLADSQGAFPPHDDGRLVEWFPPDYSSACIVYGPDQAGVGPDHVDGHGGLQQPGTLAADAQGNVYVPVDSTTGFLPTGRVLKFAASSFPADAGRCSNTAGNFHQAQFSVFVQGSPAFMPFPAGIARDPACACWAVSDVIGSPAVAFYDDNGNPLPRLVPTDFGAHFSPYGIAFDPEGNLFVVDIHITQGCNPEKPTSCVGINLGPQSKGGQLLEFSFPSHQVGPPGGPPAVIGSGYDFPVSVTTCVPQTQVCPAPRGVESSVQAGTSGEQSPAAQPPSVSTLTLPNTAGSASGQVAVSMLVLGLSAAMARRRR